MTRQRLTQGIQAGAAVVALVVVAVISLQCLNYHRAPARQAPAAGPSADQLAFEQHQRAFEATLGRLMGANACLSPEEWNRRQTLIWAKQYPVHMIVQPVSAAGLPTWGLVVKPWSFTDVGGYVKGLCAG